MTKLKSNFWAQAILSVILIFLVFYFAFGAVFGAYTAKAIEKNEAAHAASLASAAEGETMTLLEDIETVAGVSEVYETSGGGYIIKTKAQGINGPLVLNVGVSGEGTVSGIVVDTSFESADVGELALKEDYLAGFIGKDSTEGIDALTGATYTSNAVRDCVDKALLQYRVIHGLSSYDGPVELSEEELLAQALSEHLGDTYTPAETEYASEMIKAVYTSDAGYGMLVEGAGHNGAIRLLLDMDPDGVLRDIVTIAHSESPDHGAKVLTDANYFFLKGYSSFAMFDTGDGSAVVDMFTSATETSFALLQMLQAGTAQYALMNPAENG